MEWQELTGVRGHRPHPRPAARVRAGRNTPLMLAVPYGGWSTEQLRAPRVLDRLAAEQASRRRSIIRTTRPVHGPSPKNRPVVYGWLACQLPNASPPAAPANDVAIRRRPRPRPQVPPGIIFPVRTAAVDDRPTPLQPVDERLWRKRILRH